MGSRLVRTPGIYLTGFMGSGKTTIGLLLADELGWPFADLDADIEAAEGCAISDLFLHKGEAEFRRIEHEALKKRVHLVHCGAPVVLALGGGAFTREENRVLVSDAGLSLWLDAPFELIRQRIAAETHRPLARDPDRFAALFAERRGDYAKADYHVAVNSNDNAAILAHVLQLPLWD
ncbi:MAG: shikimate kinase [Bryobacterales bacterium]|nr:shikimate kinase [Bryobacterales bacterium]